MKATHITLTFKPTQTIPKIMQIHLKDITDSICLAAHDPEALREIELHLKSALALVTNLQMKARGYKLTKGDSHVE